LLRTLKALRNRQRMSLGKNVRVRPEVRVLNPHNISIGDNTYVNGGYLMAGPNSKIRIGSNCLISYEVHLRSESHNYLSKHQLIRHQGNSESDIVIGDDVWIGFGAQIMMGVTVGDGAVIGAGAIVTRDVSEYRVVAGVPAREIGSRE